MPCLRKGEKEHDVTLKPFVGTRGLKSHPVEPSQQPERVLRRGAVTNPAKRRQLVQKPCDSASKAPISEPSFWIRRGPCRRHREGHGGVGLGGVPEQGRCTGGFLRNVGSPVVSRGNRQWGKPNPKPPVHLTCASAGWKRNRRHTDGYRQSKETKCGERDGRMA